MTVFKDEIRAVLESEMSGIKSEIQGTKIELSNFKAAIKKRGDRDGEHHEGDGEGTFWLKISLLGVTP